LHPGIEKPKEKAKSESLSAKLVEQLEEAVSAEVQKFIRRKCTHCLESKKMRLITGIK
jgi:hypothetical protein